MELLILANSRKLGGRCIAGIDLASKKWVRPVRRSDHGEISKEDCLISDGGVWRDIEVLDVVSAPIGEPIEALGQPENRVLVEADWSLNGKIPISEAEQVLDLVCEYEETLLYGTGRSVYMQSVKSGRVSKSLTLIKVVEPTFYIDESPKKLRCCFQYSSNDYDLPVTDDSGWVSAAKVDPVSFSVGTWFFTVSLGEAYRGQMWKLIAAGISISATS
jgi:hypothetical protein